MTIKRFESVVVGDDQQITVTAFCLHAGIFDDTVRGGTDGCAPFRFEVHASVKLFSLQNRIDSPSERAGDPFVRNGIAVWNHLQHLMAELGIERCKIDSFLHTHLRQGFEPDHNFDFTDFILHAFEFIGFQANLFHQSGIFLFERFVP